MPEKKRKTDSFGLIFLPPVVILCNTGNGGKYHRSTFIGCRALQWTYSARRPWCQITRLTSTEAAQVRGSCSNGPTPFSDAKNNCLEIIKGGIKSEQKWNFINIHTSVIWKKILLVYPRCFKTSGLWGSHLQYPNKVGPFHAQRGNSQYFHGLPRVLCSSCFIYNIVSFVTTTLTCSYCFFFMTYLLIQGQSRQCSTRKKKVGRRLSFCSAL